MNQDARYSHLSKMRRDYDPNGLYEVIRDSGDGDWTLLKRCSDGWDISSENDTESFAKWKRERILKKGGSPYQEDDLLVMTNRQARKFLRKRGLLSITAPVPSP